VLKDFFRRPTELLGPIGRTSRLAFAQPQEEERRGVDEWLAATAEEGPDGAEVRLWRLRAPSLGDRAAELPKLLGILPKARPDEIALLADAWLPAEPTTLCVPPGVRAAALAFRDGGRRLAASAAGETLLWDLARPWELPERTPADATRVPDATAASPLVVGPVGGRRAEIDEQGRVVFFEGAREIVAPPSGPPCRATVAAFNGDGGRLAVGDERGSVTLWLRRREPPPHRRGDDRPPWIPVHLGHGRQPASRVVAAAFDGAGERLAVWRVSLTEPPRDDLEVCCVRVEDLEVLARGHAGRELRPIELPPEVWVDLFGAEPPRPDATVEGPRGPSHPDERRPSRAYLKALGLGTEASGS
jgi:hypothetical protein